MQPGLRMVPLGFAQVADVSGVVALPTIGSPAAIPIGANIVAVIVPETQSVRWRDDGTDPSATVGMLISAGTEYIYSGDLSKIKLIQTTASAKLNVSYYRVVG